MGYKRFVLVEIVGVMSSAVEDRPSSSAFSVGDDGIGPIDWRFLLDRRGLSDVWTCFIRRM